MFIPQSLGDWAAWCTIIGLLIVMIGLFFTGIRWLIRLDFKVDTMWLFLRGRGLVEGVEKGILLYDRNFTVPKESRDLVPLSLQESLISAFSVQAKNWSDSELELQIAAKFNDELIIQVCIPNRLMVGSCLRICAAIVREAIKYG